MKHLFLSIGCLVVSVLFAVDVRMEHTFYNWFAAISAVIWGVTSIFEIWTYSEGEKKHDTKII